MCKFFSKNFNYTLIVVNYSITLTHRNYILRHLMTTEQPTGPLTLADVRQALADTDPNSTNAGKIREKLGRGSFATIQKHLETLRSELAPVVPVAPGSAPAAPADAVSAIWGAAWAQAQILTLGRLESVTAERDASRSLADALAQDVSALSAAIDEKTAGFEVQTAVFSEQLEKIKSSEDEVLARAAELAHELGLARAEIEKVTTAAAAAATLAERETQIKLQTLQTVLDKAISEVSDYKSLLARLTPSRDSAG